MEATLQGIFEEGFDDYTRKHALPLKAHKAADAIRSCRTARLGGHVQRCPDGHVTHIQYNSCKHRSCPRCAALPKARWVDDQQAWILACDHFHAIFTMPRELQPLWQYNRRWFVDVLFQCVRETLMELLTDEKYLGAVPGIIMSLHTWGRTLNLHPHIHCLITGGGLDGKGKWKSAKADYLLPVR
ncbi:MAG: transposase, partial [Planctomycetes bacterium]|nr:transposase [Planctomycetota bacterium]